MAQIYPFVKGQTKEPLNFTLINKKTGAVISITGATITIYAFHPKSKTELFNGSCTIDDAAAGEFHYDFIAADLNTLGTFEGLVKIVFSDAKIGKIKDFYIKVIDDES